jgi:xylulokinase
VTDNRNIADIRYDDDLIRMTGIDRAKLPELRPTSSVLGPLKPEVAEELGLRDDVAVITGTPDLQAAAVGSGAVRDFEGHLYLGTSSWLTCHVPFKKTDLFHNMATLPSAIPNRYFVANEQETAGACLTFLRDNLLFPGDELSSGKAPEDVYRIFDRMVETAPPGSHKVIFTPWLYGERTPIEDHSVRADFFNLSLQTTRADLIRAVYEGVAFNARWLLSHVEPFIGRRLDPINFIGGGAKSDAWCQIFADVFDRTIRQVRDPIHANVRGAGFQAAAALKYLKWSDISDRVEIAGTYRPNPANRAIYDALFKEFRTLYQNNKATYARLNRR